MNNYFTDNQVTAELRPGKFRLRHFLVHSEQINEISTILYKTCPTSKHSYKRVIQHKSYQQQHEASCSQL